MKYIIPLDRKIIVSVRGETQVRLLNIIIKNFETPHFLDRYFKFNFNETFTLYKKENINIEVLYIPFMCFNLNTATVYNRRRLQNFYNYKHRDYLNKSIFKSNSFLGPLSQNYDLLEYKLISFKDFLFEYNYGKFIFKSTSEANLFINNNSEILKDYEVFKIIKKLYE